MKTHLIRYFIIVVCTVIVGCDSTRFFYNHADWLLNYRADRYFDLDSAQTPAAKQEIANWLAWHRRTQLVCYANLIDQFEDRARVVLSDTDVVWLENRLQDHYGALVASAIEPAALILNDLDEQQINHLERRLAKDQKKFVKEFKPDQQARLHARAKKTVDGIEKWFGKLSRDQVDWLQTNSRELPDLYQPWLEYRALRDRTLIELLRTGADAHAIGRTIAPLWLEPEASMASEAITQMNDMKLKSHQLAVAFYNRATARQKAHFWSRLRDYRNDFLNLANARHHATCELPTIRQASTLDKDNYLAELLTNAVGV
jgi:hypothetical protein